MFNKTEIKIERDNLWRITKRTQIHNGENTTSSYLYNNYGDLHKVVTKRNDNILYEETCQYDYDEHCNKTMKIREINHNFEFLYHGRTIPEGLDAKSTSTFYYKNEYENNNIIKKTCFSDNVKVYENLYYYNDDKLIRIERYPRGKNYELWRYELLSYQDSTIEKTVYLSNDILSHFVISQLNEEVVTSKQIKSPVKGKYHWLIYGLEDNCCSIDIDENLLTADILLEISNYIISIKKAFTENTLLVIGCSDTEVDTSDKQLAEVERCLMEQGISIQYVP